MTIVTLGIDLANYAFILHRLDASSCEAVARPYMHRVPMMGLL